MSDEPSTPPGPPQIFRDDALRVLAELEPGSIDLAVFDPPYPTISGGSNDGKGHGRPSGILKANDGKIFQHNAITPDDYLPLVHRALRDQAHLYLMTNAYNLISKDFLGAVKRAGFQIHNLLPWVKNNATPNRWYMKNCEYTVFARKGAAFPINDAGSKTARVIFEHPLDWDNVPSPKSHPTEKPVNLMRSYILNSSKPGDVVLDPFMGTGATGVAAEDTDRRFVGIEMDPTYFERAAQRLGVEMPVPLCPVPDGLGDLLGTLEEAERAVRAAFDLGDLLGPDPELEDILG